MTANPRRKTRKITKRQEIIKREAAHLIRLRSEAGLTQTELAKMIGVSQSYIARIETGSLDPKLSVAGRIREVLIQAQSPLCSQVMTTNPITVDARDPVSSAIRIMKKRSYSQLPVLRGNRIVGMITERDIVKNLGHDISTLSVQAVMSQAGVPILSASTPIASILPLFQIYQAVLVHDQGRLSGIITRSDLLRIQI